MDQRYVPDERRYSPDEIESALCTWEWMLEHRLITRALDEVFDAYGSAGMRSTAVQVGCFIDKCFLYSEEHGLGLADESFDWGFVPIICREIDWQKFANNNQYGDGAYAPDVTTFMATLVARRALALEV